MGSRRKVPRYRNPSAAHEAKATLYAKPRDPINPVLSSDRVEMSPPRSAERHLGAALEHGAAHAVEAAAVVVDQAECCALLWPARLIFLASRA